MPKIIKVIGKNQRPPKAGFFEKIWNLYLEQDKFTKMASITMLLILLTTPFIISSRLIFKPHAQDSINFIATSGAKPVFSLTNYTGDKQPASGATILWATSSPSKSKITYWEDSVFQNLLSLFSLSPSNFNESSFTTSHSFIIPEGELKSNTTYNYKISVTSSDGEEFTSHTYSFKTS